MSQITVGNIQNLAGDGATQLYEGLAKSWVEMTGAGTAAITNSFGIGSITDNGTGDYSGNLSTSMSSADYSVIAAPSSITHGLQASTSTSAYQMLTYGNAHTAADGNISAAVFGDLA